MCRIQSSKQVHSSCVNSVRRSRSCADFGGFFDRQMKIAMRLLDAVHFRCLNARGTLFTFRRRCRCSTYSLTLQIVSCCVGVPASEPGARVRLGGPRQCLRVDILPDVRQFAISNGNGEDPIVLERPIRSYDSPRSDADDQNPVSLRYELGGLWEGSFHRFVSLLK